MITDIQIAKKLVNLSNSAKNRDIEFDVSFKRMKQILNTKSCFYTKSELNFISNDDNQLTIDRIDNNVGYIDSNIVACSAKFNRLKKDLTSTDIKNMFMGLKRKGVYERYNK